MLVLTRKLGESIIIGDEIKITLLEIKGGQARLGIEAPQDTTVHREEVFERIKAENILAASLTPNNLNILSRIWKKKKE